jgi:hypothetical protein
VHLFRYLYYGALLPNTFYVKTGGSEELMLAGLTKLREMFTFNRLGLLVMLTPLAFVDRKHRAEKLVMAAIAAGYMAYVVKVGVDEMRWHRLYLPALPFLVLLAGLGLHNLARAASTLIPWRHTRIVAALVGWALVGQAAWTNFDFTYQQMNGFNVRGELSGNFHPDLGKFITRHERPGGLVAFQDMGSTPYHAPDIRFLDFIGLTDGTVAHARDAHKLHAYMASGTRQSKMRYNEEMREYFYERSPEWAILTTYIHGNADVISQRFDKNPTPTSLGAAVGANSYQFGIYNARFRREYAHVRTWPRSRTYYLSLFRRRDLWEQTPGEVVLDALPEGVGGIEARFDHGLELLGTEMETEIVEHHEFFLTTWWRLPGPLEPDIYFFVHVESADIRHPYDAIPGDWMYPADRWQANQVLEHRVLVQIPTRLQPGTYSVYMGAYRRSTGERLAILEGPNDGGQRLRVGTLTIRPMRPLLDHLIKKTDPAEQRRYPERTRRRSRPPRQAPWRRPNETDEAAGASALRPGPVRV